MAACRALYEAVPIGVDLNVPGTEAMRYYQRPAELADTAVLLRDSDFQGETTYKLASDLVLRGAAYDPNGYRARKSSSW